MRPAQGVGGKICQISSCRDRGQHSCEQFWEFPEENSCLGLFWVFVRDYLLMTTTVKKPPEHLKEEGRKIWRKIAGESELDEPSALILQTLCEQYERMNEARELIKSDGLIVKDRFGQQKQHPAYANELSAAAAMMRAWRLLGYDQADSQQPGLFDD
jgi:P27 family predicted phage terminase small subunit